MIGQYIFTAIMSLLNLVLLIVIWNDVRYLGRQIFKLEGNGTDDEDR